MIDAKDYLEVGLAFHGHKCPAMPLGLRSGAAALNALGVERSKDKELFLLAETGDDHAAGCFVDGLMTATGCTYGKSNINKTFYGKMAFTLVDTRTQKAIRVQLKPDFFANMLKSPFVEQRKKGVLPQDIPSEVVEPLVNRILNLPEEEFLTISQVSDYPFEKKKGIFETALCEECGERTFVHKLQDVNGKKFCIPCAEKPK
ncbi:MAG: formylmethanofuran dehydrogenase [Firmicutes bacterium]|nr:formylmethanofuran dehydrogenase [Bacillota bacterium]